MPNRLVKPKSFLKQCTLIVSKYVECHDPLRFELVERSKGLYVLCNTNNKLVMEGDPSFFILQVKNSKGLYLHVSTTLKAPYIGASAESNHDFEGISIQFLQGTGKLFCRAEWDVKKNSDKLEHPQPHWHWGTLNLIEEPSDFDVNNINPVTGSNFLQEIVDTPSALPSIDFEELHYAMCAKWVLQDTAVEEFDERSLYNWLKYCIENVIDQYNYQANKSRFVSSKNW